MNRLMIFVCGALVAMSAGCQKRTAGWDESATAALSNARDMWGKEGKDGLLSPDEDFISLKEDDLKATMADGAVPQPRSSPGEKGSGLPGIEHFNIPSSALASVFRNLYFNTDDHILRGEENISRIEKIAGYLNSHPSTYIFITGNCDERGPEAYNLALGARRANYVRSMLVQKGVNGNQIHTVSYGKDQPLELAHTPQAWAKNRRAEFRIYEK